MSYNNPTVFSVPDAVGLDLALQNIQTRLSELPWLTKIFGRAWPMNDFQGDGRRLITTAQGIKPKTFQSSNVNGKDGNYIDVLPNDNLNSYSFFVSDGNETTEDYSINTNIVQRPMSLIVWVRLNKVDASKPYIFLEELKEGVYAKLKTFGQKVTITGYTDQTNEVWQGFEWSQNENKNLRYPNMGFRIFFTLYYNDKTCL